MLYVSVLQVIFLPSKHSKSGNSHSYLPRVQARGVSRLFEQGWFNPGHQLNLLSLELLTVMHFLKFYFASWDG